MPRKKKSENLQIEDKQAENIEKQENAGLGESKQKVSDNEGPTGKEITVEVSGHRYSGLCMSYRETNTGPQVYLKLNGMVNRWFSAENITVNE